MKKALKISLISLLSLLVLLIVAISIVVWIVFTPSRLTPMVREQAAKYLTCQTDIGEVELTFFSTFPEFSLKIEGVNLVNPVNGAPNDTLLAAHQATAALDFKALWNRNELIMREITLSDVAVNAFVDKNGKANYDVMVPDTTAKDTSAFSNPFKKIDISAIKLRNAKVSYLDLSTDMKASLADMNADMQLDMTGNVLNAKLNADANKVSFKMDSVDYVKDANIKLAVPVKYDFDNLLTTLADAKLELNGLKATLDGQIGMSKTNDDIRTDLTFSTEKYGLAPLLKLIPAAYTSALDGMKLDGFVSATGSVQGIVNEKSLPLIDVNAILDSGTFEYNALPYKLYDLAGNADVKLNMNNERDSKIVLNEVHAKTGRSQVDATGLINYILSDDMLFDLSMKMKLNLPELEPMMPEDMNIGLEGYANGTANVKFMLSDAMNANLTKMNIGGNFDVTNLGLVYDSISMYANKAKLAVAIPNKKSSKTGFIDASLWADKLKYNQGKGMSATILNADIKTQTSDLTKTDQMNNILCGFRFDHLTGSMDGMQALLDKSNGNLDLKMNFSDSVSMPSVVCDFDIAKVKAIMDDTTSAVIAYPKGRFSMLPSKKNPANPAFDIRGTTGTINAAMGSQQFSANDMNINTNLVYDDKATNALQQWQAKGNVAMNQGKVVIAGINDEIHIPAIKMDFTPDFYNITDSRMTIGKSDFKLVGKLWNVDEFMHDKGLLKGDFDFTSNTTDVYQLIDMTSGFGEADTTATAQAVADSSSTTTGPYMVPKGVDLKLHAKIDKALLGFDSASNILGDIYVKDGVLALEDLRFTTSAARMQITSMYKSPRRNHLYAGINLHILDIEIPELLSMIPDVDTIMPMLRSFRGKAEFHFALETNMDSMYNLKKSTLIGASSIRGDNLVLMDGETFSEIAKILRFNKKTENKIDSLNAEFTIFRNEVDIYPFQIVMDKYKAVVDGRHNLDMTFKYHISVTDSPLPIKFGVNIQGTMDDIMNHPFKCIRPAKCKYANLYRPAQRKDVDTKKLDIIRKMREALKSEVVQ
ncbi:MAG: hypothetical protein H6Q20_1707 [Bacteroidetes bacterium]|nr:hypothetical protein [Bacteroidota bacterium]